VTDFCAGGNWTTTIQHYCHEQVYSLSQACAKHLTRSLLEGVAFLHARGICHIHLTPDNLLLTVAPPLIETDCDWKLVQVKIADFSLAFYASPTNDHHDGDNITLTPTASPTFAPAPSMLSRLSTLVYTAPEMLQETTCTAMVDMWSVGACVYLLCSGKPPFVTSKRLIKEICSADYDLTPLAISSPDAKQFIASLMHSNPQVRLTAEQALEHSWLSVMDTTTKPTSKLAPSNCRSPLSWLLRKSKSFSSNDRCQSK
jgi:calcium-dependent protein kinase